MSIRPVTTLIVELGPVYDIGPLPGGFRRVISIAGGSMTGPVLTGRVLPGGADWNTAREDGSADVWARYTVQTDDGVTIGIINAGTLPADADPDAFVTSPRLEVPDGALAWLRDVPLVGTLGPVLGRTDAVRIGIFSVHAQ
ncbi:DUF3237 domain-containing protein [Microbacterium sp. RG1]|uniref:DUF3237 domain-containing protein n=1 Tax=Microbacterium sp. RG1 TaxID=2489212 RepID=UPI0010CA220C|nr:DUF3237 domain-containing protein [Microbacterium sp. RG1]QCQ16610.1 DUF3237 domain-containing protein [Microbacterium sp. RG1]